MEAIVPATGRLTRDAVLRRADFLINEACSNDPARDQTVTFAMRVISNYVSTGRDLSSAGIKKASARMSRRALEQKGVTTEAEWLRNTINEHQEPLKQIWKWILDHKATLSAEDVVARFAKWPMVTVTKDEDIELRKHAHLPPAARYKAAKIEVMRRVDGNWELVETEDV
jgi:hypothetical protein